MKYMRFQLTLINEDESERYLFQSNSREYNPNISFTFYKRKNTLDAWHRVYKQDTNPYTTWGNFVYDESVTANTIFNPDAVTSTSMFRREYDATIDTETLGNLFVSSVNQQRRSATLDAATRGYVDLEHTRHVRAHQEAAMLQAEIYNNELARREAQREAARQRQEEERNRPRRPWDRVRDYFRD